MGSGLCVTHGIRLVRPAPALEPFVRFYGTRESRLLEAVFIHPVHARAAPILDFEFGDADAILYVQSSGRPAIVSPRSVLVGMQTHKNGQLRITGIVNSFFILFPPDGLNLLFALPAVEFTDRSFDAESVLGPTIARLHQQLADCSSFGERISVANQYLIRRAAAACARDGVTVAATQILRRAGRARIPAMADRAGLSVRQFRRKFVQQVGVSPKLFARIARFEAALDGMARSPGGSWTQVAQRFGYFDQMHMVHEFAEFTGETPTQTFHHFEAAFQEQIAAIRSGSAPRPDGDRLIT
jgi:AraC-like DNA-binding protein